MIGILFKYFDFYSDNLENPINMIKGIPKAELVTTISKINSLLKPVYSSDFDSSVDTQIECLKALFLNDQMSHVEINRILKKCDEFPTNYRLFERTACLYALQEILSYDSAFFVENKKEYSSLEREQIFKYILSVNTKLNVFDKEYREDESKILGSDFFEYFMFKELMRNQYNISFNILNHFYKSHFLLSKLLNDELFGEHIKRYFLETYSVENPLVLFKNIMYAYFKSYDSNLRFNYLNIEKINKDVNSIFKALSQNIIDEDLDSFDSPKLFDFLYLKKKPLYFEEGINKNDDINTYIILDNLFFAEKLYSLFINDFWFDYLKPNNIINREQWGDFIGSCFFEEFIDNIFSYIFSENKNIKYISNEDLKFSVNGQSEIEYADFYLRDKQKIILIEAKSNFLPMVNGFKSVKNLDDYKKLDLEKFYKDYGVKQLASKTIKKFHEYKNYISDDGLNTNRKVHLYPMLIVNDPIISSHLSVIPFKRKFEEYLKNENINLKNRDHQIHPLSILNISELQHLEKSLRMNKFGMFWLLDKYVKNTDKKNAAKRGKPYDTIKTMGDIIKESITDTSHLISERVRDFSWIEDEN